MRTREIKNFWKIRIISRFIGSKVQKVDILKSRYLENECDLGKKNWDIWKDESKGFPSVYKVYRVWSKSWRLIRVRK